MEKERRFRGIELGIPEKDSSQVGLIEKVTFEQRLMGNDITVDSGQVVQAEVFRESGKMLSAAGAGNAREDT